MYEHILPVGCEFIPLKIAGNDAKRLRIDCPHGLTLDAVDTGRELVGRLSDAIQIKTHLGLRSVTTLSMVSTDPARTLTPRYNRSTFATDMVISPAITIPLLSTWS